MGVVSWMLWRVSAALASCAGHARCVVCLLLSKGKSVVNFMFINLSESFRQMPVE